MILTYAALLFWLSAAAALLGYGITSLTLPSFIQLLRSSNQLKCNYKGQHVPASAGVVLVLVFAFACFLLAAVRWPLQAEIVRQSGALLIIALGMAFVGLLDDMAGSRDAGGFKGHLQKLVVEGTLTTGLIKAFTGFMFALGVVMWGNNGGEFSIIHAAKVLLQALVIALTANWINLLDVRPGRALKGTALIFLLLLPTVRGVFVIPLWILSGIVTAYFPYDIKAKAMLGDAGANFIGAVLGYIAVQNLHTGALVGVLTALLGLHIYTELYSLSRLIERNGVLTWLDGLGQEEAH